MMKITMQNYCLAISLTGGLKKVLASMDVGQTQTIPEDDVLQLTRQFEKLDFDGKKIIEYETFQIGEHVEFYSVSADRWLWGEVIGFPEKPRMVNVQYHYKGRPKVKGIYIEYLKREYIEDYHDGKPHKVPDTNHYDTMIDPYTGKPRQKTFYENVFEKAKTYTIGDEIEVEVNGKWIPGLVWDFPEDDVMMTVRYRGQKGEVVKSDMDMTSIWVKLRKINVKAKNFITKYNPNTREGTHWVTWTRGEWIKYSLPILGGWEEVDAQVTGFPEYDSMITITYKKPADWSNDRSGGYGDVDRDYASRGCGTTSEDLDISNKCITRINAKPVRELYQNYVTKERLEHDNKCVEHDKQYDFKRIFKKVVKGKNYPSDATSWDDLYAEAMSKNISREGWEDWLQKRTEEIIEFERIFKKVVKGKHYPSDATSWDDLYAEAMSTNISCEGWEAWLQKRTEEIMATMEDSRWSKLVSDEEGMLLRKLIGAEPVAKDEDAELDTQELLKQTDKLKRNAETSRQSDSQSSEESSQSSETLLSSGDNLDEEEIKKMRKETIEFFDKRQKNREK